MVDYKVFYALWTTCVVVQCMACAGDVCSLFYVPVNIESLIDDADKILLPLLGIAVVGCVFSNWLYRTFLFALVWGCRATVLPWLPSTYFAAFTLWASIFTVPILGNGFLGFRPKQKIEKDVDAVFITGCDSGMGYWTAIYLAQMGYHVYAGCYNKDASEKVLHENCLRPVSPEGVPPPNRGDSSTWENRNAIKQRITCIEIDVTDDKKVSKAIDAVFHGLKNNNKNGAQPQRLVGLICCAALGYNGPAEYFPMKLFQKQMDVNYYGYIRVIQGFLPLMKDGIKDGSARRGRIICIGTGGGTLTPTPPLLAAYMASKFAIEAFVGCMRVDFQLTNQPIDCVMVNPGFIKPTTLAEVGLKLTESMWKECYELYRDHRAKDAYGKLLNTFIAYTATAQSTHVSKIAHVMEQILHEHRPNPCYKVGEDSKATPVVGLLPVAIKEFIIKYSIYKQVGST